MCGCLAIMYMTYVSLILPLLTVTVLEWQTVWTEGWVVWVRALWQRTGNRQVWCLDTLSKMSNGTVTPTCSLCVDVFTVNHLQGREWNHNILCNSFIKEGRWLHIRKDISCAPPYLWNMSNHQSEYKTKKVKEGEFTLGEFWDKWFGQATTGI